MVFFFLIPSDSAAAWKFSRAAHDRLRDLAFPRLNLLSWYILMVGGCLTVFAAIFGGVDTGWTFYTVLQQHVLEFLGAGDCWVGIFITGFSSISDRAELHRDDSHHVGAPGHDVVSPAAVHLVALRRQPDHGSGHAGGSGDAFCRWARERLLHIGIFDPKAGRRSQCCSSIYSGSTPTRPSTS